MTSSKNIGTPKIFPNFFPNNFSKIHREIKQGAASFKKNGKSVMSMLNDRIHFFFNSTPCKNLAYASWVYVTSCY